jgi:hypothetical protein
MAQNQSFTQLAVTTVACGGHENAGYEKLHILHSGAKGKTLIVGDGAIEPLLNNRLHQLGITYLNRGDPHDNGLAKANALISEIMAGSSELDAKSAFLLRNQLNPDIRVWWCRISLPPRRKMARTRKR